MVNLSSYEEGIQVGIEHGQYTLLLKLLRKKLGTISEIYLNKLEYLENKKILDISLNIFDIRTIDDLAKYLP